MAYKISTRRRAHKVIGMAILAAAPLGAVWQAKASTVSWIANSGSYQVGTNWQFGNVPQSSDDALVVNSDSVARTVTFTGASTIDSLTLSNSGTGINTLTTTLGSMMQAGFEEIGTTGRGVYSNNGGINQINFGDPNNQGLILGNGSLGGAGTYTISNNGALLDNAGNEVIGNAGAGTFIQGTGNNTLAGTGSLVLGKLATGTGYYQLNSGGMLNTATTEVIGDSGAGTFSQTGGTNSAPMSLILGNGTNSTGSYFLSGGTLSAQGTSLTLGKNGAGTFNVSGGTLNVGNGTTTADLIVGSSLTGTGAFIMSGPGVVAVSDSVLVGTALGQGTFTVNDGTFTVTNSMTFASNNSVAFATQNGGTINIGGNFNVGSNTSSSGVLNQNSGTLNVAGTINLGGGSGAFGGIGQDGYISAGAIFVGGNPTSTSFYLLSPQGMLNTQFFVLNSHGSYEQTGGVANIGTFTGPGSLDDLFDASGFQLLGSASATLNGGTLNALGLEAINGNSTFTQNGGLFSAKGLLLLGNGSPVPPESDFYYLNAGTLAQSPVIYSSVGAGTLGLGTVSVGSLLIALDGTLVGTANGYLNADAHLQGGTVSGVLNNQGTFYYDFGTFSAQLNNSGVFYLNGNTLAGGLLTNNSNATFNGPGTINTSIANSGTINATGGLTITQQLTNTGTINVPASNSLIGTGSAVIFNNAGGVLNIGGQVTAQILNIGGAINATSTFVVPTAGSFINGNGGVINLSDGMTGSGSIQNGGLIQGGGAIQIQIVLNSGTVLANNPAMPMSVVAPLSDLSSNCGVEVAPGCSMILQSGLDNIGMIALEGPTSTLSGGSITNLGTIKGAGDIANQILNIGVLRAESGELDLGGSGNTNANQGQIITDANTIEFFNGLPTNQGVISLGGGVFDNGGASMSNSGTISGRGTFRSGGLTNSGTIQTSAGLSDIYGAVTNTGRITVTGGSTTTFYNNVDTTAAGASITVNTASTVVFLGNLTGQSHLSGPGTKDFEGAFSTGALATLVGNTIVGPAASGSTNFFNENAVTVYGSAQTISGTNNINTLSIPGGTLDLTSNDLITPATPISTIAGYIAAAYNGGAWNGPGLTSSSAQANSSSAHKTALGYATAAQLGVSTFDGEPVSGGTVLVRYTLAGDANLDGKVNAQDFDAIASNYGKVSSTQWFQGDFNYDGMVNTLDFNALAANYNATLPDSLPALGTLVPEPCFLALTGVPLLLLRPRKRKM